MSNNTTKAPPEMITVKILDRDYGVSCPKEDVDDLCNSARLLDERMREIRRSGKIVGIDRIAVMAALNISHELIKAHSELATQQRLTEEHITNLNDKIERALASARELNV